MTYLFSQYPFQKKRDIRSAMAKGLAQLLATLDFAAPAHPRSKPVKLRKVYKTWAQFQDRAMSADGILPAAAVLPDRGEYANGGLVPRLLESTWVPEGQQGFALQSLSDYEVTFVVVVRGRSEPEREAIVSSVEDFFIDDGLINQTRPDGRPEVVSVKRYGKRIRLDDYYQRPCRYTLTAQQLMDSESSAKENRWLAQFEFLAQCQHVRPVAVRPMTPKVQVVVDGC